MWYQGISVKMKELESGWQKAWGSRMTLYLQVHKTQQAYRASATLRQSDADPDLGIKAAGWSIQVEEEGRTDGFDRASIDSRFRRLPAEHKFSSKDQPPFETMWVSATVSGKVETDTPISWPTRKH